LAASALRTIPVAERLDENGAERLEVDMTVHGFQGIARQGQTLEMFREIEEAGFVHRGILPGCSGTGESCPGGQCKVNRGVRMDHAPEHPLDDRCRPDPTVRISPSIRRVIETVQVDPGVALRMLRCARPPRTRLPQA